MYAKAIRVLARGYLPISLISPSELQEILNEDQSEIQKTNQDYDIMKKDFIYILLYKASYFWH